VAEICHKGGFSDATLHKSRVKFAGKDVLKARRLRELEAGNANLNDLLAEAHLGMHALKSVLGAKR
jgi:putative transposase